MKRFFKGNGGFTLIELLVVIAIIGILATIVLVSLNSARERARDSRRVGDLRQIALALELYYDDNTSYPEETGESSAADCDDAAAMVSAIEDGGYMTTVPTDPADQSNYLYETSGQDYILGATLETDGSSSLNNDVDGTALSCDCADPVYCIQP